VTTDYGNHIGARSSGFYRLSYAHRHTQCSVFAERLSVQLLSSVSSPVHCLPSPATCAPITRKFDCDGRVAECIQGLEVGCMLDINGQNTDLNTTAVYRCARLSSSEICNMAKPSISCFRLLVDLPCWFFWDHKTWQNYDKIILNVDISLTNISLYVGNDTKDILNTNRKPHVISHVLISPNNIHGVPKSVSSLRHFDVVWHFVKRFEKHSARDVSWS